MPSAAIARILCVSVLFAACVVAAQPSAVTRRAADGVYTAQQAQRGAVVYARECAECHGADLKDDSSAAPLAGRAFVDQWQRYSAGDLFERIRATMPKAAPASLTAQEYADILAQMLKVNGFPPGNSELQGRLEVLKQIRFE